MEILHKKDASFNFKENAGAHESILYKKLIRAEDSFIQKKFLKMKKEKEELEQKRREVLEENRRK